MDDIEHDDATVLEKIQQHELTIFKLSESISAVPINSEATRNSDASEGILNSHPASLQADFTHYKELFSKLRFSYLEQVTKEKFLRAITEEPPLIVEQDEISKLEAQSSAAKSELQQSKAAVDRIVKELDELSRRLSTEYVDIRETIEKAQQLPRETAEMEEELRKLRNENDGNPELNIPLPDTLELLTSKESELAMQEDELRQLQKTLPERQRHLQDLNNEISPMETDKAGIEKFASEAVRMRDSARAAGKADRENTGQWYKSVHETLSTMLEDS